MDEPRKASASDDSNSHWSTGRTEDKAHGKSCALARALQESSVPCPMVARVVQIGETLQLEGGAADTIGFIKTGSVVLLRTTEAGSEIVHGVRGTGDFLGLEGLIHPVYLDTARALTKSVICSAPRDAVSEWLGPAGAPAHTALMVTLKTMANSAPRGAGADGHAAARVARWLSPRDGARETSCEIPRKVLAGVLGMAPETLSRVLARLQKTGAIVVTRKTLRVVDPVALAAFH